MASINLGILAHVDAGKTTLTERLLYDTGVIDRVGRVDDGTTQTDTLDLERRRGITIRSAVVSFTAHGTGVNLLDTPGHPDFIAEVERVLGVLDGVVLVVSAVEGVQAQTRVLHRTLRRLRLPTIIFVNKTDRAGARPAAVLTDLVHRLTPGVIPMDGPLPLDRLAEHDDDLLAAYAHGQRPAPGRLRAALAEQTRAGHVHPVYTGSAVTGDGVPALIAGITTLLRPAPGDPDRPASGTVFKIDRGPAGEKLAWVRMFHGAVNLRDRLPAGRITGIDVHDGAPATSRDQVTAGQIGILRGLTGIRVGDPIGARTGPATGPATGFAPPSLETVVHANRRDLLHTALTRLAEQDPLIGLRQDGDDLSLTLYGEVQKEIIEATLAEQYGLHVTFRPSTTLCVERPTGTGTATELIGAGDNPFLATVGLRAEPAPPGTGNTFTLAVEPGSMPAAFFTACRAAVTDTLTRGPHGWQVTDCAVTLTHNGYWARQSHAHAVFDKSMSSTAGDFRHLTPLVLAAALRRAGTQVLEPVHTLRLELPTGALPAVLHTLARHHGTPTATTTHGATTVVDGEIPAARIHDLRRRLPGRTHGEGLMDTTFDRYEPARGPAPVRPRTTGPDPYDRTRYLLTVVRRTSPTG